MSEDVIFLNNMLETEDFAQSFAKKLLSGGLSIGLCGQLGAGKTTFVSFMKKEFGIDADTNSPSFVLQNEYKGKDLTVEHWDLYRIDKLPIELLEPPAKKTIRIIEWADKFNELLNDLDYILYISCPNIEETPEAREIIVGSQS